jgi:multiple sugar transport system permease protein
MNVAAMRSLFLFLLVLLGVSASAQDEIVIRMLPGGGYGIPPKESTSTTAQVRRKVFEEFHRQNPGVRVVNAGGLTLNGGNLDDSMFLMSMAGDSAPDIFYVNFRQYYTFLEQGFCRPLDDLVSQNPEVMERCNPTVKKVLTSYDGKVYAIPFFQVAVALYYRRDFFKEAGLDPQRPPQNWQELYQYSKKLTVPEKGRYGFAFSSPPGYQWSNWLYAAGGEVVQQDSSRRWKAAINSPNAAQAIDFFRKMFVGSSPVANISKNFSDDIRTGKTAMWLNYTNDVVLQQSDLNPSMIGIARVPAGPNGFANEVNAGMWAISSSVKDPKKLAACWKFIQFFAGDEAARINTAKCVELGIGNQVNPMWLKKFGYTDLLSQVDPSYVQANEDLFKTGHPEPYGKNCQQVYTVLDNALDRARLNPNEPVQAILAAAQQEMDEKLLGYTPPETLAR